MNKLLITTIWLPATLLTIFLTFFYLKSNYRPPGELSSKLKLQANLYDKQIQKYLLAESMPQVLGASKTVFAAADARPALISQFLTQYQSPLVPYAQFLVDIADKYGLDYSLVPAMAMQESEACKKIPKDSFNCWGYGIYGDQVVKFASYETAIEKVAQTLKEKYIEDSLTNPDLIMSRWTPASKGSWSYAVNYFMQQIKQGN